MIDFMAMADDSSGSRSNSPKRKPSIVKRKEQPPVQNKPVQNQAVKHDPKITQTNKAKNNQTQPAAVIPKKKPVYLNIAASNSLTQEHARLTYKDIEVLEKKIEEEKESDFRQRVKEGTADLDHEALYKKLNAKSSPVKTGANNPYFNKNRKKTNFGKVKPLDTMQENGEKLDEFGKELKVKRSERNQNFQRQDMNKKYEAKVSGMAHIYKTRFMPNGRSKAFYKNLDTTENLGTDPKTHQEVEEEFMYKAKSKFDFVKDGAMNEDDNFVTQENVFFKMINKGMGFLMMSRSAVPSNQLPLFDSHIQSLYQLNDWLGVDCKNEDPDTLDIVEGQIQGQDENLKWRTKLKNIFGHENFYDFQRDVLNTCFDGVSSLVDFYTGAGKSLIFQFFSILRPGMTVVLVPLISLMIDQIKKIPGEIPAICYNSWVPFTHRQRVFNLIKQDKVKILFVTPELFVSDIAWRLIMYKTKINLICIDEAHCVSESSHSFRHSYSFLKNYVQLLNGSKDLFMGEEYFDIELPPDSDDEDLINKPAGKKKTKKTKKVVPANKKRTLDGKESLEKEKITEDDLDLFVARVKEDKKDELQNVNGEEAQLSGHVENEKDIEYENEIENTKKIKFPVLCLTATSSASSRKDIIEYFTLAPENVKFSNYYLRDNLCITVSLERSRQKEIDKLFKLRSMRNMKPILVYCNFKVITEIVATYLKQSGINALCFNTNLTELERMNVLQTFLKTDVQQAEKPDDLGLYSKIEALVTTVSLAMGIDHRSIRSVIHYNMPNSLETYVQEVGRAGRDGKRAQCHVFLNEDDYYFQRARAFTDYFLDRELVRSVIRMVLGLREDLKKLQSGEINKKIWAYIKNPQIKSRFDITQNELLNIFKHLKVYFDQEGVSWEYTESLDVRGMMKELQPTLIKEFKSNKLIELIKSKSEQIRKGYCFDIVDIANIVNMNPFLLSARFRDLGQKLKFSFIPDHPAYLFTRPKAKKGQDIKNVFNVDNITEWLIKRNNENIQMNSARVDALYMVLRDHAKKSIDKFLDDDLVADKNLKMEKYIKMYFSYGPLDMIKKMRADGAKDVPILEVSDEKNSEEYAELKDHIAKFFKDSSKHVAFEMMNSKGYGKVFRHYLKMIMSVPSTTFSLKQWQNSEFWGYFAHYGLTGVSNRIEELFVEFYTSSVSHRVRTNNDFGNEKQLKKTKPNDSEDPIAPLDVSGDQSNFEMELE